MSILTVFEKTIEDIRRSIHKAIEEQSTSILATDASDFLKDALAKFNDPVSRTRLYRQLRVCLHPDNMERYFDKDEIEFLESNSQKGLLWFSLLDIKYDEPAVFDMLAIKIHDAKTRYLMISVKFSQNIMLTQRADRSTEGKLKLNAVRTAIKDLGFWFRPMFALYDHHNNYYQPFRFIAKAISSLTTGLFHMLEWLSRRPDVVVTTFYESLSQLLNLATCSFLYSGIKLWEADQLTKEAVIDLKLYADSMWGDDSQIGSLSI